MIRASLARLLCLLGRHDHRQAGFLLYNDARLYAFAACYRGCGAVVITSDLLMYGSVTLASEGTAWMAMGGAFEDERAN